MSVSTREAPAKWARDRHAEERTMRGIRMRRLAVVAVLLVASFATPAAAGTNAVVWDAKECDETAVLLAGRGLPLSQILVALVYRCASATVDGTKIGEFAVSEISMLRPDGTSTLLRQVTDDPTLHSRLRRLGLRDSFLGSIDYQPAGIAQAPKVSVSFGGHTYSFAGAGGPSGVPPLPSSGGASYTYEGRRGTIELRYTNHTQAVTPALVSVDASEDPVLRRWLGADRATGSGVVAAGDWTGTASLID